MTATDAHLSTLRALTLEAAPELRQAPLYITRPPRDYPPTPYAQAWTTFGTDYAIRQALIDAGLWEGPGAMIVICSDAADLESLAGLIVHEVAHNLPFHAPGPDRDPTDDEARRELEFVKLWATEPPELHATTAPWLPHHGLPFVRNCLHLLARFAARGFDIPLPAANFAGGNYGLSLASRYRRALGDEPPRLARCSFSEIHSVNPPAEFSALFAADVAAWEKHRSSNGPIKTKSAD